MMQRIPNSRLITAHQHLRHVAAEAGRKLNGIRSAATFPKSAGQHRGLATTLCLLPGAGHIYIGQHQKGMVLFLLAATTAVLIVPPVALIVLSIVDVCALCGRLQKGRAISRWECFWHPAKEPGDTWKVERTIKTGRTEAAIGDERRLIDNRSSSSKLVRTIKAAREWTHTVHVQREQSTTRSQKTIMQVNEGLTRERSLEEVLRDQYGCSQGSKFVFEENVQVEVQPNTQMAVVLHWKYILEVGAIVLSNQEGQRVELPYSVVVGITFDQAQTEG
jgi:hypothetical protein